jgi:hypothetical protein
MLSDPVNRSPESTVYRGSGAEPEVVLPNGAACHRLAEAEIARDPTAARPGGRGVSGQMMIKEKKRLKTEHNARGVQAIESLDGSERRRGKAADA